MANRSPPTDLRLYPEWRALEDGEGIYSDLELPSGSGRQRPYTAINMVSSVDGETSVAGKASGIGGAADRRAMRALRSRVDAVMIGAGTLRAERLNLGLDDPTSSQPLAVIVGGSGRLPLAEHLTNDRQTVLVVLPDGPRPRGRSRGRSQDPGRAEVLRAPQAGPGPDGRERPGVDLAWVLERLVDSYGVERLLVEGGPALNRELVLGGLADELFLTLSPVLLASGAPRILSAAPEPLQKSAKLVSVHAAEDHLFLRYGLPDDAR